MGADDDDAPEGAPRAVMWTIGKIAERDGVSKPAVSKKVKELVEQHGLAVERDAQGRVATVNVVQYDRLRGRTDDPSKAQAPGRIAASLASAAPATESYNEALRQKTWHEAERGRLALAELKGQLVRTDKLDAISRSIGEEIAAIIDRLPNETDSLAAAVAREGSHGLRVSLKELAFRLRRDIADRLRTLADLRPKFDPDIGQEIKLEETT